MAGFACVSLANVRSGETAIWKTAIWVDSITHINKTENPRISQISNPSKT